MSAPLQPKEEEEEEEKISATLKEKAKKEKKMSGPLQPKEEEEEETSATCRSTLTDSRRTLAEVTFAGAHRISTTVTHSGVAVAEWINETIQRCSRHYGVAGPRQRHAIGLEVACRPNGSIALLQLCVGNRCLIYQLLHSYSDSYSYSDSDSDDDYPAGELFSFFRDDRFCFVAAGVDEVVYRLRRAHSFLVRNTADLGEMAATRLGREDLRRAGLERLARKVMGLKMDALAEVQMSEWWQRHLSRQQIACASVGAFISFELGRILFEI
ncbi:hypothetical protein ACMD2_13651 [Ananas comosus]|uniref:Werner Syndrome-like exonuclease n=1 Tax=Ananas comosus TaxID=4615 RepID=A0A199UUG8_ANACO|nr:hypothetical protein ACMD2_13651 [Ananas comosus]